MPQLFRIAVAAVVALTTAAAAAQSFPARPVQLIVPFPGHRRNANPAFRRRPAEGG